MGDMLCAGSAAVLAANAEDIARARELGMPQPMIDRLLLTAERIKSIAEGVKSVALLPDPLSGGETFTRPNGLVITK